MAKELDSKKMWAALIKHTTVSWIGTLIKKALKDQGFEFDGENIVPIESEFKIEAGKWYVCIKPCLGYTVGRIYKAAADDFIITDNEDYSCNCSICLDYFRPATEEEIAASGQNENQIGGQKKKLSHPKVTKKSEQNPAWSEEDSIMLEETVKSLKRYQLQIPNYRVELQMRWLKNLKDRVQSQTTWKPSDEQIEALVSAIDVMIDNRGAGDKNTILLSGLYHELKAL